MNSHHCLVCRYFVSKYFPLFFIFKIFYSFYFLFIYLHSIFSSGVYVFREHIIWFYFCSIILEQCQKVAYLFAYKKHYTNGPIICTEYQLQFIAYHFFNLTLFMYYIFIICCHSFFLNYFISAITWTVYPPSTTIFTEKCFHLQKQLCKLWKGCMLCMASSILLQHLWSNLHMTILIYTLFSIINVTDCCSSIHWL